MKNGGIGILACPHSTIAGLIEETDKSVCPTRNGLKRIASKGTEWCASPARCLPAASQSNNSNCRSTSGMEEKA